MAAGTRLLAVNATSLAGGGGRTILRQLLEAITQEAGPHWRVRVFVRDDRDLPRAEHISYVVPRLPARGWAGRAWFEQFGLKRALRGEDVDTFLSMQGSSARLRARRKFVYCHNANGLVRPPMAVVLSEPRIALLNVIYGLLYRFAIGPDPVVIVQQSWLRDAFAARYGLRKCIVAYPVAARPPGRMKSRPPEGRTFEILYPIAALPHKNAETLCEAARLLAGRRPGSFRVTITLSGDENSYARRLRTRYGHLPEIAFVGTLTRPELEQQYRRSDLLVFPSRVEAWGLPLTEAKQNGLGILAADLPYAHEAVGTYDGADFFDPGDAPALADRIEDCWSGRRPLRAVTWPAPGEPYAPDWRTLVAFILDEIPFRPVSSHSEPVPG